MGLFGLSVDPINGLVKSDVTKSIDPELLVNVTFLSQHSDADECDY